MIANLHDPESTRWEKTTVGHVKKLAVVNGVLQTELLRVTDEEGHLPVSRAIGHGANVNVVKFLLEQSTEASLLFICWW